MPVSRHCQRKDFGNKLQGTTQDKLVHWLLSENKFTNKPGGHLKVKVSKADLNVTEAAWWYKKGSPYSITERRVPELIPVLGSQPAGDVNHKPDITSRQACSYPRNP